MSNYLNNLPKEKKKYFNMLEPNFPDWLLDYINTKEMLFQNKISVTCGIIYSKLYDSSYFFSNLDHSVAVALIIWHFTKDKKQTLAGLFHDIAVPAFKHCIDFLNGDYIKQESIEDKTSSIIENSCSIMNLLKRDNINISDVDDYKLYPIADNDTPKLSADRLEYSLSNALFNYNLTDFYTIEKIYNNITIQKDYNNIIELGFTEKRWAIEFVRLTSILSVFYRDDKTRYSMQFIADVIKKLCSDNIITIDDLYSIGEKDIINIILNSKYGQYFKIWSNSTKVLTSKYEPSDVYFVHHTSKVRYINPLLNGVRIYDCCKIAKKYIDDNLSYNMDNYVYLNFNFK